MVPVPRAKRVWWKSTLTCACASAPHCAPGELVSSSAAHLASCPGARPIVRAPEAACAEFTSRRFAGAERADPDGRARDGHAGIEPTASRRFLPVKPGG